MDPMKSRRWIAAAALAAAVVFLVMITSEHGPAAPDAATAPVSSSGAVLASDGGPPEEESDDGGGGAEEGADREEVIDAVQGLLDALGISAEELVDGGGCNGQEQSGSESGNKNGDNNGGGNGNGEAKGDGCEQSEPAASGGSAGATITIAGFAFGQAMTVEPGATVEVVNSDAAPHNLTASDGSFETPDLKQDEKATFTAPTTPGRYEFTCTLHPEMTGTLIVEGAGKGGDQGRARSSEPTTGSERGGAGTSGGDHSRQQHDTTAPSRGDTGGSSDGY